MLALQGKAFKDGASFVTAHTFCASLVWSKIFRFLKEFAYLYKGSFARFMTMWKKKTLARAITIQKENWGQPCIFQR